MTSIHDLMTAAQTAVACADDVDLFKNLLPLARDGGGSPPVLTPAQLRCVNAVMDPIRQVRQQVSDAGNPELGAAMQFVGVLADMLTRFTLLGPGSEEISTLSLHPTVGDLSAEILWIATNIASGTTEQTAKVESVFSSAGLIAPLLLHPSRKIVEQNLWMVGNIAGDTSRLRDRCLAMTLRDGRSLPELVGDVALKGDELWNKKDPWATDAPGELNSPSPGDGTAGNDDERQSKIRQTATWLLSNLVRGKPQPDEKAIAPVANAVERLLKMARSQQGINSEMLADLLWAASYMTDGADERIHRFIHGNDVVKDMMALLVGPVMPGDTDDLCTLDRECAAAGLGQLDDLPLTPIRPPLSAFMLQAIVPFVPGWDLQKSMFASKVWYGHALARHPTSLARACNPRIECDSVLKPALRAVSNIASGSDEDTQTIVDLGFVELCEVLLESRDVVIVKETLWGLSNIAAGTQHQARRVIGRQALLEQTGHYAGWLATDDGTRRNVGRACDLPGEAWWVLANLASTLPADVLLPAFAVTARVGLAVTRLVTEMIFSKFSKAAKVAKECIEGINLMSRQMGEPLVEGFRALRRAEHRRRRHAALTQDTGEQGQQSSMPVPTVERYDALAARVPLVALHPVAYLAAEGFDYLRTHLSADARGASPLIAAMAQAIGVIEEDEVDELDTIELLDSDEMDVHPDAAVPEEDAALILAAEVLVRGSIE